MDARARSEWKDRSRALAPSRTSHRACDRCSRATDHKNIFVHVASRKKKSVTRMMNVTCVLAAAVYKRAAERSRTTRWHTDDTSRSSGAVLLVSSAAEKLWRRCSSI